MNLYLPSTHFYAMQNYSHHYIFSIKHTFFGSIFTIRPTEFCQKTPFCTGNTRLKTIFTRSYTESNFTAKNRFSLWKLRDMTKLFRRQKLRQFSRNSKIKELFEVEIVQTKDRMKHSEMTNQMFTSSLYYAPFRLLRATALFLATIATLAIFTSTVASLATVTALAVIAATATLRLATIATLAVFTSTVAGLATVAALAVVATTARYLRRFSGNLRCMMRATGTFRSARCTHWFVAVHGTHVRAAGKKDGQRKECRKGYSEDNMVLLHDKFPFC